MRNQRQRRRLTSFRYYGTFRRLAWTLPICILLFVARASAQEEDRDLPQIETAASRTAADASLPKIATLLQGVTTQDLTVLGKALHTGEGEQAPAPGAPSNTITPIGGLNQESVPDVLLKWAAPDTSHGLQVAVAPDSQPLWNLYLLCWDGAHWRPSRLLTGVEDFLPAAIDLGPPVGRGLALVVREGKAQIAYPVIFQVKDHSAALLWDSLADESRYQPLLQGQVTFQSRAGTPAEMTVAGRANPGLLQVSPSGNRGFQARAVYRWDGKAFIPAKTEYSANPDYTIYRFISALHLHDYRSAYALVVPAEFLKSDSPMVDTFRHYIQDNLPEFLRNEVFEAPELPADSADEHMFVLSTPEKRYVYHPVFSNDGKFLLTGLTRAQAALPSEPFSP